MRKIWFLSLFIFTCLASIHFTYKIRHGFNVRKISHFKNRSPSELSKLEDQILRQKFSYLSRGRQCFVFASEDGNYVLKIPRTDHINTSLITKIFPKLLKDKPIHRNKEEIKILKSFEIASHLLAEETALIGLHFGLKNSENLFITLQDPLGFSHKWDIKNANFVIQRRTSLWADLFTKAKKENNRTQKELLILSAIDFFVKRSKKTVANSDNTFDRNFGFENGITFQIDIGDFRLESEGYDPINNKRRFYDALQTVKYWLEKNDPEMIPFLETEKRKVVF